MDLYMLGKVSWWESQCIYHALAELGREGLILCYPERPYVCLGLHDDLDYEINLPYCQQMGLPLLRRETGGGVVYLDGCQLFYQVVLRKDNSLLPIRREHFYRRILRPAITVYRQLGMPVEWKEPADLVCRGAKCSGNGAGDIGKGVAFVGNLLFDFDYEVMASILKAPHQVYRDFLALSMRSNMCSLADFAPLSISLDEVSEQLAGQFEMLLGPLHAASVDDELRQEAWACKNRLTTRGWLNLAGRRSMNRRVKIAEGIYLHHAWLKKDLEIMALIREGIIEKCFRLRNGQAFKLREFQGRSWNSVQSKLEGFVER